MDLVSRVSEHDVDTEKVDNLAKGNNGPLELGKLALQRQGLQSRECGTNSKVQ